MKLTPYEPDEKMLLAGQAAYKNVKNYTFPEMVGWMWKAMWDSAPAVDCRHSADFVADRCSN